MLQILTALNYLAEAISGCRSGSKQSHSFDQTLSAPLLLTAVDGTTKSVQCQKEIVKSDAEKSKLRSEVQQLKAELRLERSKGVGSSKVAEAVQQLEAVVPQYKAVASALQSQITVLKEKLAAACHDKSQLQAEVKMVYHAIAGVFSL